MMRQPNILIFMTDHQRADTVLPEHPAVTPNLDRFVADGLAFTNAFCPSPHCCPSRATFHSGLYPSRHGVWNNVCNGQRLSRGPVEGVRLFSDDLAEAGYNLAWSGKWHVGIDRTPKDHGWQEHYLTAYRADDNQTPWDRYRRVAEQGDPAERAEGQMLRPGWGTVTFYGSRGDGEDEHDRRTVDAALAAMPALAAGGQPWSMFVGLIGPHDPYVVPQKYLDLYDLDDVPLPPNFADTLADKPAVYARMRRMRWGQFTEREYRDCIRHFWAYCSYLDDKFGQVLAALDATGQADDTLVLYVSDHGDYCGEHGLFAKGIPCFRGAYHVPAVMRWPNGIARPGQREEALVSLADFAPTFTELAGKTADPGLTGRSLTPFLAGQTPANWRDEMHTQCNGVELYYTQRSVMTRDWKYVFNGFDEDELYDLRRDPHETVNLARRPDMQPIIRQMCRRMWRFAHEQDDAATNAYVTVSLAPFGPAEAFR